MVTLSGEFDRAELSTSFGFRTVVDRGCCSDNCTLFHITGYPQPRLQFRETIPYKVMWLKGLR